MSLLNGNNRAVPDVPFYMSEALQEFMGAATGNISEAMLAAEVAVPGLVSQLGGLSASTTTHTITVGYAEGSSAPGDHMWRAYGYSDGTFDHDAYFPTGPYGNLNPLTVTHENLDSGGYDTLTIFRLDGWFDGGYNGSDYVPQVASITTNYIYDYGDVLMDITFPNGRVHHFNGAAMTNGFLEIDYTSPMFAETMQEYEGQTIGIDIVLTAVPYKSAKVDDTGVYVNNLLPTGATDALYFIDPLMFGDTGEIKAFVDIPQRDAEAPQFTEMVPKPPANYYPGTHAYVDGEWVPK